MKYFAHFERVKIHVEKRELWNSQEWLNIYSSFPLSLRNASFSVASILSLKKNLFYSLAIGIIHQV